MTKQPETQATQGSNTNGTGKDRTELARLIGRLIAEQQYRQVAAATKPATAIKPPSAAPPNESE